MPSVLLATAGYDHTIRFWEAPSGICYRTLQYTDSQVNRIEISPNKCYLAAAGNPHIRLFEINSNNPNPVISYDGHTTNVSSLGFQREGRWMYTGSEDGTVKIWDLRSPRYQQSHKVGAAVTTVCLHPNQGDLIIGTQNGGILIWDLTRGDSVVLRREGEVSVRSVDISNDAKTLIAGDNKGVLRVWDMDEPFEEGPVKEFQAHDKYALKCRISRDRRFLATSSADKTAKIWSLEDDFALVKTLEGHQRWVWDCVFSADSCYLVTASSDHNAHLWDLESGEIIRSYTGHHKAIVTVALNDISTEPSQM